MPCNIKIGKTNENIKQLQRFLRGRKLYTRKIDGYYGSHTQKGVTQYQKTHKLYPDGQAGCKTTKHMKLPCVIHNCNKNHQSKPPKHTTSSKTIKPPLTKPSQSPIPTNILPNHTISIGTIGFYAENPELIEPFQRKIYDKIEIENGPPHFYPTGIRNREMNFKVTLIQKLPSTPYTTFQELLNFIKPCEGIQQFSSIYIGSFTALITIKLTDFHPGTAIATFNVQEIPNPKKI